MNSKKSKAKNAQILRDCKEGTETGVNAYNAKKSKITKNAKKN